MAKLARGREDQGPVLAKSHLQGSTTTRTQAFLGFSLQSRDMAEQIQARLGDYADSYYSATVALAVFFWSPFLRRERDRDRDRLTMATVIKGSSGQGARP